MPLKKIAIFVEGQTEQIFVSKLIREIAGEKNISITEQKVFGGSSVPRQIIHLSSTTQPTARYEALIRDCANDEKVASEIRDNFSALQAQGYTQIIGLRDLYPSALSTLPNMRRGLAVTERLCSNTNNATNIVIAVHEVEAWFLAECTHYTCIDPTLTIPHITANLGFDPCTDNMRLRSHPAADLHSIYQLAGRSYSKKRRQVEGIVDCLDYTNLYLNVRSNIQELDEFITHIDSFLS
jgi:hypothetical protein